MKLSRKWFFLLHVFIGIYSMGSVFSKLAAGCTVGTPLFFCLYACVIGTLGIYAIGWQQVIKHMPLTTAYINKAVTVIWGMLFGIFFFQEKISLRQIAALVLIVVGVVLFVRSDQEDCQ